MLPAIQPNTNMLPAEQSGSHSLFLPVGGGSMWPARQKRPSQSCTSSPIFLMFWRPACRRKIKQYGRTTQPGITSKIGNTAPMDLQSGHIIIMCVIVFMCSPVYIIVVVEGNETNIHPTQGKYGHKRQKGEPAARPLYINKARMHTSNISFLFQLGLLFVIFTDTNKCIRNKRRKSLFRILPHCSTCVRVMI